MKNDKKYIIGDVHGTLKTLEALIAALPDDANASNIILLGDLVDRGPASRQTVAYVREKGFDVVKGNHEDLMIAGYREYLEKNYCNSYTCWLGNGGDATLESYDDEGINDEANHQILSDIAWMDALPLYRTYEFDGAKDLLVSHAPSVDWFSRFLFYKKELAKDWKDLEQKTRDDYNLEIEQMFENFTWNRNKQKDGSMVYFGVSGHNVWNVHPEADPYTHCVIDKNYASIDTGSCFPGEPYGKLTCLEYPSMKIYQQDLIDDIIPQKVARRTNAW